MESIAGQNISMRRAFTVLERWADYPVLGMMKWLAGKSIASCGHQDRCGPGLSGHGCPILDDGMGGGSKGPTCGWQTGLSLHQRMSAVVHVLALAHEDC